MRANYRFGVMGESRPRMVLRHRGSSRGGVLGLLVVCRGCNHGTPPGSRLRRRNCQRLVGSDRLEVLLLPHSAVGATPTIGDQ